MKPKICYCFRYTEDDIIEDLKQNGRSTILDEITKSKNQGSCNCEVNLPGTQVMSNRCPQDCGEDSAIINSELKGTTLNKISTIYQFFALRINNMTEKGNLQKVIIIDNIPVTLESETIHKLWSLSL